MSSPHALLVGLPLALLLAVLAGTSWIVRRTVAPAVATAAAAAPAIDAGHASMAPPPLAILATSLRVPHGDSPEALAAAIADGKARPDLDRELVDDDGYPVMCARCPDADDADDDALREDVSAFVAAQGGTDPQFSDEQWRT
jgi:hypothetical protein